MKSRPANSPKLTNSICYAAAHDAGNRSARKAGRSVWSEEDFDAATGEYLRLRLLMGVPPEMLGLEQ